jgi:hypothetical protein
MVYVNNIFPKYAIRCYHYTFKMLHPNVNIKTLCVDIHALLTLSQ